MTPHLIGFAIGFGTCAMFFIVVSLLASAHNYPPVVRRKGDAPREEDY